MENTGFLVAHELCWRWLPGFLLEMARKAMNPSRMCVAERRNCLRCVAGTHNWTFAMSVVQKSPSHERMFRAEHRRSVTKRRANAAGWASHQVGSRPVRIDKMAANSVGVSQVVLPVVVESEKFVATVSKSGGELWTAVTGTMRRDSAGYVTVETLRETKGSGVNTVRHSTCLEIPFAFPCFGMKAAAW